MGATLSPEQIKVLKRRVRRKGFARHLSALLLFSKKDAAGKPCSPLAKQYINTWHCADQWVVKDTKLTAHRCKNRACPECNRIRTGAIINTYKPRLEEEQKAGQTLYFVTLTRRNVPLAELKDEIDVYHQIWSKITDMAVYRNFLVPDIEAERHRKRAEKARQKANEWMRCDVPLAKQTAKVQYFLDKEKSELAEADRLSKVRPLLGLRKLECTYHYRKYQTYRMKGGIVAYKRDICGNKMSDPDYDTYHPHFHILCNSKEYAEWLVATWLELCGDRANAKAQDIREVYGKDDPDKKGKKSLLEVCKYFTKLVSKIDVPGQKDGKWHIFASQLDDIFCAMSGRRVFQRFGKDEVWQCEEIDEDNIDEQCNIDGLDDDVFEFFETGEWDRGDWEMISRMTGEVLVSVPRSSRICDMLKESEKTVDIDKDILQKIEKSPPGSPPPWQ